MKQGDVLYRTGDLAAVVQGLSPDGMWVWLRVWGEEGAHLFQHKVLRNEHAVSETGDGKMVIVDFAGSSPMRWDYES